MGLVEMGLECSFCCISLSCLHFPRSFSLFLGGGAAGGGGAPLVSRFSFFVLHFPSFFFVSAVFSAYFQGNCCRLSLSLRPPGNLQKKLQKRDFHSNPVYTNAVRNFPTWGIGEGQGCALCGTSAKPEALHERRIFGKS